MIADALSMVPELIDEIIAEVDTFLNYDDHTIVAEIKERAKDSKQYKKAMDILKKVRYRQKIYRCILEVPLSFPLIVKEEPQAEIEKISTQIKEGSRECAADLNIRVD
jgi:hypothetical protein